MARAVTGNVPVGERGLHADADENETGYQTFIRSIKQNLLPQATGIVCAKKGLAQKTPHQTSRASLGMGNPDPHRIHSEARPSGNASTLLARCWLRDGRTDQREPTFSETHRWQAPDAGAAVRPQPANSKTTRFRYQGNRPCTEKQQGTTRLCTAKSRLKKRDKT